MKRKWIPISGSFSVARNESIVFKGAVVEYEDTQGVIKNDGGAYGLILSNEKFTGGTITATIKFDNISHRECCGIVVSHRPSDGTHLAVILGSADGFMVSVKEWTGRVWESFKDGDVGDKYNLIAGQEYELAVTVRGSFIRVVLDGIELIRINLPFTPTQNPVGIWCLAQSKVHITNFKITPVSPTAFVVMQFTAPYNELYNKVIKPVCKEFSMDSFRADEQFGPGVIITDIARQIEESRIVIAEITPTNPNVYYEVGYAHALNKPTILIAEKGTQLPFDVSPFRVLMYENTIDGKDKIESGLRSHLKAIVS